MGIDGSSIWVFTDYCILNSINRYPATSSIRQRLDER
jgi:hypothetical protein